MKEIDKTLVKVLPEVSTRVPSGITAEVLAELERLVGVVEELQDAAHAKSTVESYTWQWNRFAHWCSERGLPTSLPVPVELVMLYLADWATSDTPPANSTVIQALAAIDWVHTNHGVRLPRSPELTRLRRGLRRRLGVAPRRKAAPLLLEHLVPLGQFLLAPARVQVRDSLVVALRAHGFSYRQIRSLAVTEILERDATSLTLLVDGEPRVIKTREGAACAPTLMRPWLETRGDWDGPLICRVGSGGQLEELPIADQTVRSIIMKLASRAGVEFTSGTALSLSMADALVTAALEVWPSRVRNMACILLLWAGALRSDELVHVRISHLFFEGAGVTLTIPRSKTDQEGKGATAFVPRGKHRETDVVGALERWVGVLLAAGANDDTFIYCPIDRHENLCLFEELGDGTLRPVPAVEPQAVTDMLRGVLSAASLDGVSPQSFSSHSGKRGIATQLARSKRTTDEIASVTCVFRSFRTFIPEFPYTSG